MIKLKAGTVDHCNGRQENTTRTSWTANNAIPDSIIMNMICRSLLPLVEPNILSTEVGLTSKNTLRILNTIKPVIMAFTAMDTVKLVIIIGFKGTCCELEVDSGTIPSISIDPSVHFSIFQTSCFPVDVGFTNIEASDPNQVARGDKLKSAYQMNID